MQFGHFYNQNANELNYISFNLFFFWFFYSKYPTLEQTMLSSLYYYIFDAFFL